MDRIFGTVIRQLREGCGYSQSEAARRSGLSQSQWSRLEDGTHWPSKPTIGLLCNVLRCTPREFLLDVARHIVDVACFLDGWEEEKTNNEHDC